MPQPPLLLGLLAETPIHVGCGSSLDVVDLPVQRERTTGHPVVPGSGMKGAMREKLRAASPDDHATLTDVFGSAGGDAPQFGGDAEEVEPAGSGGRGGVLVGEGRLVALPVRSLQGAFFWVSCPHLLGRVHRDAAWAGLAAPDPPAAPPAGRFLAASGGPKGTTDLEEQAFEPAGGAGLDAAWPAFLGRLVAHGVIAEALSTRLVVLCDDDFAWFARHALPVDAHNVLDPETKESLNLWTEESLPPDTLMSCLIGEAVDGQLDALRAGLGLGESKPGLVARLRVGGNETTGMGWFSLRQVSDGGNDGGAA